MFTIIISEKGGAERREAFDRSEINVGRVQGNDLMLPKGNVSKHHARLLYRDGRFIVTDLKSTNGTYVNGRKISQATIVREGDKIYIGDFVLRLETAQSAAAADAGGDDRPAPVAQGRAGPNRDAGASAGHAALSQAVAAEAIPAEAPKGAPSPPRPVLATSASFPAPPRPSEHRLPDGQPVSHFPLERDPDSESAPELQGVPVLRAPGPPRLPQPDARPRTRTAVLGAEHPGSLRGSGGSPVARASLQPTPQQAARRRALLALVGRVGDAVDLAPLARMPVVSGALLQEIELSVQAQAKAMQSEAAAPAGTDWGGLADDALRELVGLGPIGPALDDPETEEVHVTRPDSVLVVRGGRAALLETSFTSEEALARVVRRLACQSGDPPRADEAILDRRLGRGERLTAVGPPIANGWTLTIRKPRTTETSLDEQVRTAAMSRSIAVFLEACVTARANLLVVGPGAGVVSPMIAALASATGAGERIAVLTESDDIAVAHAYVMPFAIRGASSGADTVRAAARLGADRLVVLSLAGAVAATTLDAIGEGTEGVLAGLCAPSLRHALARLALQVALVRTGASMEWAREVVSESFDIAIEMSRGSDGRPRVTRVAELAGADALGIILRDLFVSSADATGEAGFVATGAVPRFAQDFEARGVKLDAALFKRN
jgi:pilus assembly protein CpaF